MVFRIPALIAVALGVAVGAAVHAQNWPVKPVRIIVPFGPGGGNDIQGRLLSKKFFESMGQTFIVDNRPGASGLIGAELAARSPADGYTILFTSGGLSARVSLYKKIAFDPVKDLQPVGRVSSFPMILAVHPSVPVKSAKELIALVKKQKGKFSAGHGGGGGPGHLSLEMLKQIAGLDVVAVPYKGAGPAIMALITGETDFVFTPALVAVPHFKSGRVRPLAVTSLKGSRSFPDLPTMDSIYRGFEIENWYAIFVPAGTPREIVTKLNAEMVKALKSSDLREFIAKEGGEPVGSTPEELAAYFKREIDMFAKIIKAGNITAD